MLACRSGCGKTSSSKFTKNGSFNAGTDGGWLPHQDRRESRVFRRPSRSMVLPPRHCLPRFRGSVGVSSDNGKMAIPSNTVGLGRASGQGCIISRFHDLRHTFTTWLTQCGVDYAVIQTLKGGPLPGSAKYYIHNWDGRLRDAVSLLETFTQAILSGKNVAEVPLTATQVPPYYVEQSLSGRKMVPRDRIELSTPAFSGLCSTN